jgi:hypothetical protein
VNGGQADKHGCRPTIQRAGHQATGVPAVKVSRQLRLRLRRFQARIPPNNPTVQESPELAVSSLDRDPGPLSYRRQVEILPLWSAIINLIYREYIWENPERFSKIRPAPQFASATADLPKSSRLIHNGA